MKNKLSNIFPCEKSSEIEAKVLTFNEPTINGRIYSPDSFDYDLKDLPVYLYSSDESPFSKMNNTIGYITDYKVVDDDLICTFKSNGHLKEFFDDIKNNGSNYRLALDSVGTVNENNYVDVSKVVGFSIQYVGDKSKYNEYDRKVSNLIEETKYTIGSLECYNDIIEYLKLLFRGNVTIKFCNGCCLRNKGRVINMSIISFSSDVTKNYIKGNTVSICIKNGNNKTITLYPVDAHYLQSKFNNIIKKYGNYSEKDFEYNND